MKLSNAVATVIGNVVGTIAGIVLLVFTATITPLSRAWHQGRLQAERSHKMQGVLDDLAASLAGLSGKVADSERESSTGAYL